MTFRSTIASSIAIDEMGRKNLLILEASCIPRTMDIAIASTTGIMEPGRKPKWRGSNVKEIDTSRIDALSMGSELGVSTPVWASCILAYFRRDIYSPGRHVDSKDARELGSKTSMNTSVGCCITLWILAK